MRKFLFVLLLALVITLTGCQTADSLQTVNASETDSEVPKEVLNITSESSSESPVLSVPDEQKILSVPTMETESASAVSPPQNTESFNQESISSQPPSERTEEKTLIEAETAKLETSINTSTSAPIEPNATAADSIKVAEQIIKYINDYRSAQGTPAAIRLPGLTQYAEYRSRQLISNFAHDTEDEQTAATALQYGDYIDPALYGMTGEPYYTVNAREAIAKAGYIGTVDKIAQSLAQLVKKSSSHWSYVGSSEYKYIAVGVTYESGMWYCDIAVARENID